MEFLQPVNHCHCSEVMTGVLASDEVISGKLKGRHAVGIYATSDSRIGSEQVVHKKTIGLLMKEGDTLIIPVDTARFDQLYINGTADIVEFF